MRISDWSSDVCSSDLFACAVLLGVLVARLEWGGDPVGALRYLVFGQPLLLLGIVAVLGVWGYVFGMWRRRGDYLRHDGVTLYRGASARWALALVRGGVVARGTLGLESLRLVVDADSGKSGRASCREEGG